MIKNNGLPNELSDVFTSNDTLKSVEDHVKFNITRGKQEALMRNDNIANICYIN